MNGTGLTSKQRLTVLLMTTAVIAVFAMLAGFVHSSIHGLQNPPPTTLPPTAPQPSPTIARPTPTPFPVPEGGIGSQIQAARLFDQIAHQVETLRGLSANTQVPLTFLTEREMTTLLRQVYVGRDPGAQLLPYVELGLLPQTNLSLAIHQTAGIYVPEQKQLYVAAGRPAESADDQTLLAHSHVHALQDQHFDLGAMDARAATSDERLATGALIEGDAMLLTAFYRYTDPSAADWDHLTALILPAEQPGYGTALEKEAAWKQLELFPYREGRQFAGALFQAGGWEAINRAYTTPPRSTEQVLHPERYIAGEDNPIHVAIPDLGATLGAGWEQSLQDTLGEFVAGLYLSALLPEETAWQAAAGWGGDTFVAWEQQDGSQVRVWRTIWDSSTDAQEFESALIAAVPHRYLLAQPLSPTAGQTGQWWETASGAVAISRVARYVTLVETPDVGSLTNVTQVLP